MEQKWETKSIECLIKVFHLLLNIGSQFLHILTTLYEIIYHAWQ